MSRDVRTRCVVCAWRGECTKKFKNTKDAAHCPDYTRDVNLPAEDEETQESEGEETQEPERGHKRVVDPFAD